MLARSPHRRRARAAYSLVEVVAAISLMSATLVPAVSLVRDAIRVSQECDRRQLLALYAVSQLEQRTAQVAANWAADNDSGDYGTAPNDDGHPDIRYESVWTDEAVGGQSGVLMDIRTTVYFDADSDDLLDADELRCEFRTKLGRFATYEVLAP